MVRIHYGERATVRVVVDLIDSINKKLKRKGRHFQFEYEGYGSPHKWIIYKISGRNRQKLISNASNKEVYLYFLGMSIVL